MFWRGGRAGAIWLLSLIEGSDAEGGGTRWDVTSGRAVRVKRGTCPASRESRVTGLVDRVIIVVIDCATGVVVGGGRAEYA